MSDDFDGLHVKIFEEDLIEWIDIVCRCRDEVRLWTAKMYLIFVLNRQNILPIEDVAFLQSYKWMYKPDDVSKESVVKKCKKWSPYSSIATRYLYCALNMGFTKEEFHLFK